MVIPIRRRTLRRAFTRKITKTNDNVDLPLYEIYDDYSVAFKNPILKYILLLSGRGSLKTTSVISHLIEESFDSKYKDSLFVFAREVQTSIKDSLHALIKSAIKSAHVQRFFKITNTRIINKTTGVEFPFVGLRATGGATSFSQVNKIKGKHNIKYIFVDEAQDLTDDTSNVLFPTVNRGGVFGVIKKQWHPTEIRKELSAKFIFAMNPNFADDPITVKIEQLVAAGANAVIIKRNIFDLPKKYQDPQLLEQAELERDQVYFGHVWLGEPSHKISGYPWSTLKQYKAKEHPKALFSFIDPSYKGGDFTAIFFFGLVDGLLCVWGFAFHESWQNAIDKIAGKIRLYPHDATFYEDNSLGTSPENMLAERGILAQAHTTLGNKHNRIFKVAYYCVDKIVMLPEHCNSDCITQVLRYNEKAKNDDSPDALSSVLIKAGLITERMKF